MQKLCKGCFVPRRDDKILYNASLMDIARVKDCSGKPAGPLEAARGLAAKSLTAAQRRARPKQKYVTHYCMTYS
jgi:hypothetical protein